MSAAPSDGDLLSKGRPVKIAQNTVRRAYCRICGRETFIRSDGVIGEHRLFPFDGTPSKLCDGSGERWRQ